MLNKKPEFLSHEKLRYNIGLHLRKFTQRIYYMYLSLTRAVETCIHSFYLRRRNMEKFYHFTSFFFFLTLAVTTDNLSTALVLKEKNNCDEGIVWKLRSIICKRLNLNEQKEVTNHKIKENQRQQLLNLKKCL